MSKVFNNVREYDDTLVAKRLEGQKRKKKSQSYQQKEREPLEGGTRKAQKVGKFNGELNSQKSIQVDMAIQSKRVFILVERERWKSITKIGVCRENA